MKFYQLHKTHEVGESAGYVYFTRKREADKALREWLNGEDPCEVGATVTAIEVVPTRAGILAALNRYANHADNG